MTINARRLNSANDSSIGVAPVSGIVGVAIITNVDASFGIE